MERSAINIKQSERKGIHMEITNNIKYVGVNDHQVDLFEGQYQVPNGMAYNSYIILDEKIAVMDTVDGAFAEEWLQNVEQVLAGRKPDYLVIQHMEPDHSASIPAFLQRYPETVVVSTAMGFKYMEQFFPEIEIAAEKRIIAANSGTLELGSHTLHFVYAPMVHWPEVMMTYEASEKILLQQMDLVNLVRWMLRKTGWMKPDVIISASLVSMERRCRLF